MILRKYQKEIAQAAYNGQNTLIYAPTGTGKTVVAASIARNHLVMGRKNNFYTKVFQNFSRDIILEVFLVGRKQFCSSQFCILGTQSSSLVHLFL